MSTNAKTGNSKPRMDVPFLEQTAGTGWGRSFELSRKKLSIGRTTDNEIVLDSTSVSRVHAVLKLTAKGWFIEDNISKNGIWVNGIAVKKAMLRPGDVIQIGEFVFRFCDPTVPAPAKSLDTQRSGFGNKTEVLSTDTWNVGPESTPQKPPIEQSPPPGYSRTDNRTDNRNVATQQMPRPGRPQVHAPKEPMRLATFGKDNQEKLYLIMGVLGGLLVGCILYLRLQKSPAPTVPLASNKAAKSSGGAGGVAPQDAFRQIAEQEGETGEQSEENFAQSRDPKPAARAPRTQPSPAQALAKAGEEAKRPGIKAEEMQIGLKGKRQRSATKDVAVYLADGKAYLQDGDFDSAALSYQFALVIDPNNAAAKAGLQAAQKRRKSTASDDAVVRAAQKAKKAEARAEKAADKTAEKKANVLKFLRSASDSLKKRRYQEAIELAEKARQIEIAGETAYLNEAKQIIDRSEQRQKEEFEPFIDLARKKMSEGDYRGSILLCEEMLRTDPGYAPAKDCMERSTAGLAAAVPQPGEQGGGTK